MYNSLSLAGRLNRRTAKDKTKKLNEMEYTRHLHHSRAIPKKKNIKFIITYLLGLFSLFLYIHIQHFSSLQKSNLQHISISLSSFLILELFRICFISISSSYFPYLNAFMISEI